MRYLVTGGAGFIGSSLVRHLAGNGHHVTVLDDFSRGHRARLDAIRGGGSCRVIEGDVRAPDVVSHAVQGCDRVVHLAYLQGTQTFYSEPRAVLDTALRGMLNLLESCERWGTGDFMLVSSSEAYQVAAEVPTPETVPCSVPDPLNPRYSYGGGKIACEILLSAWQRAGILDRAVIARPHNIYGPDMGREHVIPEFAIRMNKLTARHPDGVLEFPIQGTGQETRSFCWIGDCVSQLALLLDSAPEGTSIWHVGTEEEKTIADVAHAVARCYGRTAKIIPGALPKGSPPRRLPDTSKIRALAGDAGLSSIPFESGITSTVAWYQEHG